MPHKTFAQKLASVLKTSPFCKISAKPRKPRPLPRRLLQFESLEERQLLTVAHAVASDCLASEGTASDYGTFNIQLDEVAVSPVTVNFQLSGTAVPGASSDYKLYKSNNSQVTLTSVYDSSLDAYHDIEEGIFPYLVKWMGWLYRNASLQNQVFHRKIEMSDHLN